MADVKKNAPAPAEEPTIEEQQQAIDALKLMGRVADRMTEIIAHEAAKGKDPVVIPQISVAIFPIVLAGLIGTGTAPGILEGLERSEKLLARWSP